MTIGPRVLHSDAAPVRRFACVLGNPRGVRGSPFALAQGSVPALHFPEPEAKMLCLGGSGSTDPNWPYWNVCAAASDELVEEPPQ